MAAQIVVSGTITQPVDLSTPAANNSSLNNILLGQSYSATLSFTGDIVGAGNYNLPGATLLFQVSAAPASEPAFGTSTLTVIANGLNFDVSLLACLTTGSGCATGNQLTADFRIPAALLNSQNVAATGLNQPHPLDLLEDDGVTDVQGTITQYSYIGAVAVPEPGTGFLAAAAALVFCLARRIKLADRVF